MQRSALCSVSGRKIVCDELKAVWLVGSIASQVYVETVQLCHVQMYMAVTQKVEDVDADADACGLQNGGVVAVTHE